jgi:small-conductance mechanosensitive channel
MAIGVSDLQSAQVDPTLNEGSAFEVGSDFLPAARTWIGGAVDQLLSVATLWQIGAIIAAALVAYFLSRFPVKRLRAMQASRESTDILSRIYGSLARIIWPAITVIILWALTAAFTANSLENNILRIVTSLLNAWIIVRFISSNMKSGVWSSIFAVLIWSVAALYILKLLNPVMATLESVGFQVAGVDFTLLRLITSVLIAIIALWIGRVAGDAAQSQLKSNTGLTPSMAGLLGQVVKIGLMVAAIMIALQVVGISLTALTVFSGAIGIGIGFGLRAIFSNFISGVIILLEKSVKVGDFIELQSGVTGEVREINIRSTLMTTNDNVDILIPNEEFITAQVVNWTLRESLRRMRIGFGVAYGTDKETVRKAGLEAAAAVQWTEDNGTTRQPQVWLVEFGDSSLNYELVVWLTEDAVKRPAKVRADYNWALHSALEKYDLEIPFPQRDLHIRSGDALRVKIESDED